MGSKKSGSKNKKQQYEAPKKRQRSEPLCSGRRVGMTLLGLLVTFMFILYFFVDEAPPPQPTKSDRPKPKKPKRPPKKPKFQYSKEYETEELNSLIQESENLLVLALDYGGQENDNSNGRLWTRWERLAKSMRTKKLFQRYDEEDLPLVARVDCRKPETKELCSQMLGGQPSRPLLLKQGKAPRPFSNDLRTDKQFLESVYDEMQPAVRYIEEVADIVNFQEEHAVTVFLFGDDQDSALEEAADNLRQIAKCGKNRNEEVAQHFEVATPSLLMLRDFEPKRLVYEGDKADKNAIAAWIMENNLPAFGEYNYANAKRYFAKSQPLIWIYMDTLDEGAESIREHCINWVVPMMKEKDIKGTLAYIDAVTGSDIAKNMGAEEYPMIIILTGPKEFRVPLDPESPGTTITETIEEWHAQNSAGGGGDDGDVGDEVDDEYYYESYYDEEEESDDGGSSEGGGEEETGEEEGEEEPKQEL